MVGWVIAMGISCAHLSSAWAGGILLLSDARVSQYQEALAGAKEVIPSATVVNAVDPTAAQSIDAMHPDVVVAIGQKALELAQGTAGKTPIVYCMVLQSHDASSASVTGVRLEVAAAFQIQQFALVDSRAKRIGVIFDPRVSGPFIEEASRAARSHGVSLVTRTVSSPKDVRSAFGEIIDNIDALWLLADPHLVTVEMFKFLLEKTLEHRVALFGFLDKATQLGALASIAADYRGVGTTAARLAQEITAKPENARTLPAPKTSPGALTINLRIAKQLGIDVPEEVVAIAHQVFR